MKTKKLLFILLVAAMLVSAVALTAAAEGDVPMWVTGVRLAYNGRSSSSPDRVVALVHVRDANKAAVEGATVTAEWTLPGGATVVATAETEFQGIASFTIWAGRGEYKLCVQDVVKDGWAYDESLNLETCGTIDITVPFSPGK